MTKKDKPNIFSSISKKEADSGASLDQSSKEKKENPFTVEDLATILDKAKNLYDEINRQLEIVYTKSGWTPEQIEKYLNNPNNFDAEKWQFIQSQRHLLQSDIWKKLGKEEKEVKKIESTKAKEQSAKDRRGKTLGGRKHWIPVR